MTPVFINMHIYANQLAIKPQLSPRDVVLQYQRRLRRRRREEFLLQQS